MNKGKKKGQGPVGLRPVSRLTIGDAFLSRYYTLGFVLGLECCAQCGIPCRIIDVAHDPMLRAVRICDPRDV